MNLELLIGTNDFLYSHYGLIINPSKRGDKSMFNEITLIKRAIEMAQIKLSEKETETGRLFWEKEIQALKSNLRSLESRHV